MADFPSLAPSPDMGQLATGAGAGIAPPSGTTVIAPPPAPPAPPPVPINYGGATLPDMGDAYQQTMQQVGVEKALQAIAASEQWMAQRGYQTDLQGGMSAATAFTKWAPLLFKSSTGMSEAMQLQQPPAQPTDLQKAQLAHTRAETTKLLAPPSLTPHQTFEEAHTTRDQANAKKESFRETEAGTKRRLKTLLDKRKELAGEFEERTPQSADQQEVVKEGLAQLKGVDDEIEALSNPAAPAVAPGANPNHPQVKSKEERDALEPGTQYIGPDGQTYTKGD